ncbi:GNAT family N-acetyltransferase [Spongiactinospora sp. TRM90649]|uniref:GNAT family N-acetyltransferase n=1 Tax=Spongiactinospora sp. TRM90649 TaxID=3031114 RepID=UPI0023F64540|nr:GNAT family N-acetyltransferase [Spongiactinospora sp. TRM90649]MDF5754423.1 GNAT family N-acetyltransferase [Spongiactinospora sp. TRM90649]
MSDVLIERLSPGEGQRFRKIRLSALAESPHAFASTYAKEAAQSDEEWEARLAEGTPVRFVAVADGADVGLVGIFMDRRPETAHLIAMWVDPACRGRGVGALLVDEALSWARTAGARHVELWVVDANAPAFALYRSRGFAPTGETMALPSDPTVMETHCMLTLD